MNALTVKELYTLEETIAKDLFDKVTYPWEVPLSYKHLRAHETITELGCRTDQ